MSEAFSFYSFVKSKIDVKASAAGRFLDCGCGWGRMMWQFMRAFDLDKLYGFEPNFTLATVARSLNPYVCVLSGGYTPDGSIPKDWFDLIVGWSIFSHLSREASVQWLREISEVLKPGGTGVFTTWGLRFLESLQNEQKQSEAGEEIHWYSKLCIAAAGDLNNRVAQYGRGEFVWFGNAESTFFGEAILSEPSLKQIIAERNLPLEIIGYDTASLFEDVFIVRRER